jgi:general secretion pathway protein I
MTLLEVMVAMAIFAIAGLTLMKTVTEQVVALATLEDKTFAGWVADNQLAEIKLSEKWPNLSWTSGKEEMAGRTYYWRWHGIETADPQFRAMDVEVRDEEKAVDPRATLRSYVSKN